MEEIMKMSFSAEELAMKMIKELIEKGTDPSVTFMSFLIASAICASTQEMSKKDFLQGCSLAHDEFGDYWRRMRNETN